MSDLPISDMHKTWLAMIAAHDRLSQRQVLEKAIARRAREIAPTRLLDFSPGEAGSAPKGATGGRPLDDFSPADGRLPRKGADAQSRFGDFSPADADDHLGPNRDGGMP